MGEALRASPIRVNSKQGLSASAIPVRIPAFNGLGWASRIGSLKDPGRRCPTYLPFQVGGKVGGLSYRRCW